ncbi:MAG: right-handed parallel beta-helix repeat-containing protein [bacterium]|nr:right-handed parallel beta-helix repeat-containing protein [bacterium]
MVNKLMWISWRAPLWGLPLLFVVILAAPPAESRVWRVEKDGSGDYAVIQDAVDASASGDTIMIGPGRYSEYTDHTYAGNLWHTYVHMVSGSLTLIGASESATVIGADSAGTWEPWEHAVGILYYPAESTGLLVVQNLAVEDVVEGVYAERGGVTISDCTIRRTKYGVWTHTPGTVHACEFEGIYGTGVITSSPSRDVSVTHCEFRDTRTAFYFSGVANVTVRENNVVDCENVGYLNQCSGSVVRNSLSVTTGDGLIVYGPGAYTVADNVFDGGTANIYFGLGANNAVCERNVFRGSRDSAVDVVSCTPRIRGNEIFKDRGRAVILGGYPQLPDLFVDMTGNYWGTANPDSISAWIVDGHDIVSPQIHGFVNFQPFSSVPVPTERTSLGA